MWFSAAGGLSRRATIDRKTPVGGRPAAGEMAMSTEPRPRDRFAPRLLGGVASAVALILGAHSAYLAVWCLPSLQDVFEDFGTELPRITAFALEVPWVPLGCAALAFVVGVVATATGRRVVVVMSWVLLVLTFGTVTLTRIAIEQPLLDLIRSVSSQ
jgi:hypothetical protein